MLTTEHVWCNLCGSRDADVVYPHVERIDTPGTQVLECRRCGLVYLSPRLSRLADNYSLTPSFLCEQYLPYYVAMGQLTAEHEIDPVANYEVYAAYLEPMRFLRRTNRMLDVGCGIGLFVAAARAEGWEAVGVDPSTSMTGFGRERLGMPLWCGDLQGARFPSAHFDVVVLLDVIEHLLDPLATLRDVRRVLRPGGLMVLRTPNWNSIARHCVGSQWNMLVTDHFYYFTPLTLARLLGRVGFRPQSVEAPDLVESEAQEVADKAGPAALAEARRRLADQSAGNCGSTVTAYAVKPIRDRDRLAQGLRLALAGEWRSLWAAITTFVRWRLSTPKR